MTSNDTDWAQVLALYDQLLAIRPNPVVALNRAIAVGELHGSLAGLAALDAVDARPLNGYQPYYAALADLLSRTGRRNEAVVAYDQALALTTNATELDFLERQRRAVTEP